MIRIEENCAEDLDQLTLDHYEALIQPRNADGSYHQTQSLIGRITYELSQTPLILKGESDFWNYLLTNHYYNLERIIRGRPEELARIIQEIETNFGNKLFSITIGYNLSHLTTFGSKVKKVFNYGNYRDKAISVENAEKLKIGYCPYCNLGITQIIQRTNQLTGPQRSLALMQLDHFYPQSRHPYLAVSFFNLIPGCSPCNAQLKGEKDFTIVTHFNPFHKSFNDYFKFELSQLVYSSEDEVEITISNKNPHVPNQVQDFELIRRYNDRQTKRIIFGMLMATKNRSRSIRQSYVSQFIGLAQQAFISDETLLKSQGVPFESKYINDFHRGKLKRDLCIQLQLLQDD
ncbi:hypothetical protein [Flagellimonas sp.]|uniref:hypothetical protein n=1 Tax=Flagellimonas sp. TaxID=2058762 RepID=UPI003AB19019